MGNKVLKALMMYLSILEKEFSILENRDDESISMSRLLVEKEEQIIELQEIIQEFEQEYFDLLESMDYQDFPEIATSKKDLNIKVECPNCYEEFILDEVGW